jgi:hypothetical protein
MRRAIHWIAKGNPKHTNSSLIRALWTHEWLLGRGFVSHFHARQSGESRLLWEQRRRSVACVHPRAGDVVVLQKVWNVEPRWLKRRGVAVVIDFDDEFDPDDASHKIIAEAAATIVCSSVVTAALLRDRGHASRLIPCHTETPERTAAPPRADARSIVWTGYRDTNLAELTTLRMPLERLYREIGARTICHGGGVACPEWTEGVDVLAFDPATKSEILASGNIGVSNKPLDSLFRAKTEDKATTYMAHGLVPICSPIPAYERLIRDGDNGFLIAPDDTDRWYSVMRRLLLDPAEWQRVSNAARRTVNEHYSRDAIGNLWAAALAL